MKKLRICITTAELAPFAKSGGLADVTAGLGRALGAAGHDVWIVTPMHRRIREASWPLEPLAGLQDLPVRLGSRTVFVSVSRTPLPGSDVPVLLLRCPELFERDELYGGPDEHVRFGLLSVATMVVCQHLGRAPDVVHCNDWHTAVVPLLLRTRFAWDRLFADTKTLLTIHNIGYQGVFGLDALDDLGLGGERHLLWREDTERGRVNLLRTGVLYADALSTVSRTYANEIQTHELGMGLEDQLRSRREVLFGIVNGVDYGDWNPRTDRFLARNYSAKELDGKRACKQQLLDAFGLPFDPAVPVLGFVSRLVGQKGIEVLADALPPLLQHVDASVVVLGSGEERYERWCQDLRNRFPQRVGFYRGFDEALAHRIEAGSDLWLMPSRYEPCGLNQMYSLAYGTVPVVRRTGGLADTVEPWNAETGTGTGFLFDAFSGEAMLGAVAQALEVWREPKAWLRLMRNGMTQDFSWDKQVSEYERVYATLVIRGR